MSDAIKFKNNKYLDTSGSVHNGMVLKTWLDALNSTVQWNESIAPRKSGANSDDIKQTGCATVDTRDGNNLPSYYYSLGRGFVQEFKTITAIGINRGNGYCNLVTHIPWWDSSGGAIRQVAYFDTGMAMRSGNGTNAWHNWNYFLFDTDTGWVNVPLNTGLVSQYGSENPALRCRKFGPVITVAGILKSNYAFTPTNDTSHRLATLPSGYRPASTHNVVMQGSGSNRWMCSIRPDGNMYISRYSNNTTTNNRVSANAWLNILVTFMEG